MGNWDLKSWLGDMTPVEDSTGLFDGNLARYGFDNVFKYKYDTTLPTHGCVKVTYKARFTAREAVWLPIETIEGPGVLSQQQ